MTRYLVLALVLALAAVAETVSVAAAERGPLPDLPRLVVTRAVAPPKIDGKLDDVAWQRAGTREAGRATGFTVLGGGGQAAPVATTVLAAFDDEALYFAFHCVEPDLASLRRAANGDGAAVWGDDHVEVFLSPNPVQGYLHLSVSAGGCKAAESAASERWNITWHGAPKAQLQAPSWQAAASVGVQEWKAEARIPLAGFAAGIHPGAQWRANFCRVRFAAGATENSAWSYVPGKLFADPQRFGMLLFVSSTSSRPVRRAPTWVPEPPVIVPQPVSLSWGEGAFRPDAKTRIVIGAESHRIGARMLAGDLAGRFGLKAPVLVSQRTPDGDAIVISAPGGGRGLAEAANRGASDRAPESYSLRVTPRLITIAGADDRGAFYGVQTLRQMLQADGAGRPLARTCEIEDHPSMAWRGWHMSSPAAADLGFYREVVDLLALLKYNTIVWEVDAELRYPSHPDIAAPDAPSAAQLAALVAYAKERHFEVIPQLATFSHFDYVLTRPEYKHLAESEKTTRGFQSLFNYCPSNPETYALVFDLMDDLIAAFKPRFFHIGHDEASFDDIGVCARCKGTDPWVLWQQDINKLHAHLAEKGVRTMMWGDQFLDGHNGGAPNYTVRATDMVPKDIIICDWHYNANHDYAATLQYFAQHGFKTLGCPWFDLDNVYDLAGGVAREHALGFLGTTWSGVRDDVTRLPHIPAAWVVGAENAWSSDKPKLDAITYAPIAVFNQLWRRSDQRPARQFELVDIAAYGNQSIRDSQQRDGWMGEGPSADLRALPAGAQWVGDYPVLVLPHATASAASCVMVSDKSEDGARYPHAVRGMTLGRRASALIFLHACAVPPRRNRELYDPQGINPGEIGHYVVHYADGKEQVIPLVYQGTIADFNSQLGFVQAQGLWRGRTAGGALATVGVLRWENPRPQVAIVLLDLISADAAVRPALLAVTLEK